MVKLRRSLTVGASVVSGLLLLTSTALAQTVPPGGAAPEPVWPRASSAPPGTVVPPAMSNVPVQDVDVSFFGPSSDVVEFMVPRLVSSTKAIGCYSGPNATPSESADADLYGLKPAGSQFIAFFVRGTRTFAYDTAVGNYCWIDSSYSP